MPVQERPIKHVLMTADTIGGVWTYALDLCRAFSARGIHVCLATMGAPLSAAQRSDTNKIPRLDVRESSYKLEWMDNPWEDLNHAGEWLLNLEKEIEPDIVHLNGYTHGSLSWNAPVIVAAHSCVLSWWQAVKKTPVPAQWDEYKYRVQQGLKAADAVVAISNTYAGQINELYGTINNLTVIYNGRDPGLFYATHKKKQAFAMGRIWDEAKNLRVLSKLLNKPQLPILVAGDNRHPDTGLLAEVQNVELTGVLTPAAIKEKLAQSYIYILPAKYEPFGLSVLEAALSGCLLLLADIPTLKELWQDTALYFNPDKPQELDKLLDEVMLYPEKYKYIIERSEERAKHYSLDAMVKNYLELYQSLMHKQFKTRSLNKSYMQSA